MKTKDIINLDVPIISFKRRKGSLCIKASIIKRPKKLGFRSPVKHVPPIVDLLELIKKPGTTSVWGKKGKRTRTRNTRHKGEIPNLTEPVKKQGKMESGSSSSAESKSMAGSSMEENNPSCFSPTVIPGPIPNLDNLLVSILDFEDLLGSIPDNDDLLNESRYSPSAELKSDHGSIPTATAGTKLNSGSGLLGSIPNLEELGYPPLVKSEWEWYNGSIPTTKAELKSDHGSIPTATAELKSDHEPIISFKRPKKLGFRSPVKQVPPIPDLLEWIMKPGTTSVWGKKGKRTRTRNTRQKGEIPNLTESVKKQGKKESGCSSSTESKSTAGSRMEENNPSCFSQFVIPGPIPDHYALLKDPSMLGCGDYFSNIDMDRLF